MSRPKHFFRNAAESNVFTILAIIFVVLLSILIVTPSEKAMADEAIAEDAVAVSEEITTPVTKETVERSTPVAVMRKAVTTTVATTKVTTSTVQSAPAVTSSSTTTVKVATTVAGTTTPVTTTTVPVTTPATTTVATTTATTSAPATTTATATAPVTTTVAPETTTVATTTTTAVATTTAKSSKYVNEPFVIGCTAYEWTGYKCADGTWPVKWLTIAGKKAWLGRTCHLYYVTKDGGIGEQIGDVWEFHDTGYGREVTYKGKTDGDIVLGLTVDIYLEDDDECRDWGRRNVYIEFLD